jgi:hypothetical protein
MWVYMFVYTNSQRKHGLCVCTNVIDVIHFPLASIFCILYRIVQGFGGKARRKETTLKTKA